MSDFDLKLVWVEKENSDLYQAGISAGIEQVAYRLAMSIQAGLADGRLTVDEDGFVRLADEEQSGK
jgi:hypothetical protein